MPQVIILDDAQARTLAEAREAVELRDRRGRPLGTVRKGTSAPPPDAAEEDDVRVALSRRGDGRPRYTTDEALAHLRSLEDRR